MNLGDQGRVRAHKTIFGRYNPDIAAKMETQVEKWAFYRENVHRHFNYLCPKNLLRGAFWLVFVPVVTMKFLIHGMKDGEANNFKKEAAFWPEVPYSESGDFKVAPSGSVIQHTRLQKF